MTPAAFLSYLLQALYFERHTSIVSTSSWLDIGLILKYNVLDDCDQQVARRHHDTLKQWDKSIPKSPTSSRAKVRSSIDNTTFLSELLQLQQSLVFVSSLRCVKLVCVMQNTFLAFSLCHCLYLIAVVWVTLTFTLSSLPPEKQRTTIQLIIHRFDTCSIAIDCISWMDYIHWNVYRHAALCVLAQVQCSQYNCICRSYKMTRDK